MSNYYYLIAGLPDISLEDGKLSYTVADFKEQFYPSLSQTDKNLIDLFYLKYDNANVLKLLKDKDSVIDPRGNYSLEKLLEYMKIIKEEGWVDSTEFPAYLILFLTNYYNETLLENDSMLQEDCLAAYYYDYGLKCKNDFVASWFEFNLTLNNVLIALTARKYKIDLSGQILGNTETSGALRTSGARDFGLSGEVDYFDDLAKIAEIRELMEREKKTDLLKWNWIEDAAFFHYFSVECLFAFLLKVEMVERWLLLDKKHGSELFREIIGALKDEVRIPAEFRK